MKKFPFELKMAIIFYPLNPHIITFLIFDSSMCTKNVVLFLTKIAYRLDRIFPGMVKLKNLIGILERIKERHCEMARTLKSPLVESEKARVSNNPNFAV